MSEPAFTRDGTTALYWADPAERVAAFLATDPDTLGPDPSLTATWGDAGGAYVFLGAPAGAAFLADLTTWLADHRPQGPPRFLWVADPAAPVTEWLVTEVPVTDGLVETTMFQLADYALGVTGGNAIGPAESPDGGWGFVLTDSAESPALTLYSPVDVLFARTGTGVLSMTAGHTGSWRFVLDAAAGGDAFTTLGAGVRFFTAGTDGYVNTVHFGAVRQPGDTALTLYAEVDPLRPFDRERTSLAFHSWAGAGTPPPLDSGYATAHGHSITLQPQASARLVFGFAPFFVGETVNGGYYFVPDGAFAIGHSSAGVTSADGIDRVVCGTSGLEYLGIPLTGGCALTFVPGQAAYAPLGTATTGENALTEHGTTSWVYVESPPEATVRYYSQPEDAPLFSAPDPARNLADDTFDLLDFYELPAATLPSTSAEPGVEVGATPFPMAPFRGLAIGAVTDAVAIEQLALAPRRRAALVTAPAPLRATAETVKVGVTPQGLGVGVAADDATWTWLGIGHTGTAAPEPDLRFTTVSGPFRQAMQTNNLFLVLGNPTEFVKHGSVAYELDAHALDVIGTLPGPPIPKPDLDAVRAAMAGKPYGTRGEFLTALRAVRPFTEKQEGVFLRYAGQLTPVVGGWPFRLSPDNWGEKTYVLMKFVLGRSVANLVRDVSTWAWPEAASATGKPADAQTAIAGVIDAARQAVTAAPTSPYANFLTVVDDPDWTGVLALNVDVPLEQLPPELQVLAAGIDATRFGAHHFGMSVTPYKVLEGRIAFERSSMFGLIDYLNPEDQYFDENIAYAFRVLQLTVGIRNSAVTTFTSRAELLVNRLFGASARLLPTAHGNNVILDGAHQRQRLPDGTEHDTYVFSMSGDNLFNLDGAVLRSVELLALQLVTAKASDPASGTAVVDAVFQLSGNLRFYEPAGFDPFCWGPPLAGGHDSYLRFGNLAIGMTFALGDPANTTVFTLKDGNLSFDQANSVARPGSLVARFPIRLSGLVATADPVLSPAAPPQTPADLGYVGVTAPLEQSALSQPWYGLDYTIDLGTLGALAGSKALAVQVLVAWSPGKDGGDPSVAMGVKLPGAKDVLGVSLPLQGVVKMGFKGIEFLVDDTPGVERSYTVRMRDFALRLLGLAFPPGHNDVILFGNPDQSGSSKVGWYMAYASDADPKRPPPPPTRAEVTRRRAALRGTGG
ncbi:MAG TPA: hypothetical protein VNQ77_04060 [Frankiaceae bacterium]|nr:hypothetical protein [Frankiaceae bacterium]